MSIFKNYLKINYVKKCRICVISRIFVTGKTCADTFLKSKKAISLKKFPLIVGFCKCSHLSAIYQFQVMRYDI